MALADLLKPRLTELGKIKIGGKETKVRKTASGGEWRAPVKLDHFRVTTLQRNQQGDLIDDDAIMDRLVKDYGDSDGRLRQIPIALLSDEPDDVMQSAWVCYAGKRVAARSDGKTVEWFFDRESRKWLDTPITEPFSDDIPAMTDNRGAAMFKLHTTFNCVITTNDSRWGGVYKFRTTSRISADQLYGSLLHLRELTRGVLAGLPLRLVVRPIQVAPEGKATTVYVVHVELRGPDFTAIQDMAAKMLAAKVANSRAIEESKAEYRKLLVAPGYETDQAEIIDVVEEFHPDQVDMEEAPPTNGEAVIDDLLRETHAPESEPPNSSEPDAGPDDDDENTF